MSLALRNTEPREYQFTVRRPGGGEVSCTSGNSVVKVDRSQERPIPAGVRLMDSFLADFLAQPEVAEHLPAVRKEFAEQSRQGGAPVTLRMLRMQQGLSQKDLGDATGTTQAAVSQYESRRRKPGEEAIRALAEVLDVDFNTLMDALANG